MKKLLLVLIFCGFVFSQNIALAQSVDREALLAQLEALTKIVLDLQEQLNAQRVQVDNNFTFFVIKGNDNVSVKLLQQILASDPLVYPEGITTGFFGDLTETALKNFQKKWKLDITGTFTNQTRTVLSATLAKVPFKGIEADYLQRPEVEAALKNAIAEYKARDIVVNGQVVFSAIPNFAVGTTSTDIYTLQRILATDPAVYPEKTINGVYDEDTAMAVSRFQKKYGITVTTNVDTKTLNLLKAILQENEAETIASDLLLQANVQPGVLLTNADRDIISVSAVRDYRKSNVVVSVAYEGGIRDSFLLFPLKSTLGKTAVKADVLKELALSLERTEAYISKYLDYTIIDEPDFPKSSIIHVALNNQITLSFIKSDGIKEDHEIPLNINWDEVVEIEGEEILLSDLRDLIITEARQNTAVDPIIIDLVRIAVSDFYLVPEKEIPEFPVIYTREQEGGGS